MAFLLFWEIIAYHYSQCRFWWGGNSKNIPFTQFYIEKNPEEHKDQHKDNIIFQTMEPINPKTLPVLIAANSFFKFIYLIQQIL